MIRWKACARLRPSALEDHPHGERRPVFERPQRAEVVRDAFGQHRHDPVGEIDRVAALERVAVEGRAGAHVSRDVGDRDGDDEAAGVCRIGIGLGVHRVVVVLGVGRIDGDERQRPPVLARRGEADRAGGFGLLERGRRKDVRDVVDGERDEADRALGLHRAQRLDDPRAREAETPLAQGLDGDEIAVLGLAGEIRRHDEFAPQRRASRREARAPTRPRLCGRRRRRAP